MLKVGDKVIRSGFTNTQEVALILSLFETSEGCRAAVVEFDSYFDVVAVDLLTKHLSQEELDKQTKEQALKPVLQWAQYSGYTLEMEILERAYDLGFKAAIDTQNEK